MGQTLVNPDVSTNHQRRAGRAGTIIPGPGTSVLSRPLPGYNCPSHRHFSCSPRTARVLITLVSVATPYPFEGSIFCRYERHTCAHRRPFAQLVAVALCGPSPTRVAGLLSRARQTCRLHTVSLAHPLAGEPTCLYPQCRRSSRYERGEFRLPLAVRVGSTP